MPDSKEYNSSLPNTISPSEYNTIVSKYMNSFLADKKTWIDNYGLEKANYVMYKTAVKKAKEESESNNSKS